MHEEYQEALFCMSSRNTCGCHRALPKLCVADGTLCMRDWWGVEGTPCSFTGSQRACMQILPKRRCSAPALSKALWVHTAPQS